MTPDSETAMKLNGGQNYTFIAYSYNTNVAPNENLIGSNLSTATIVVISLQDFMYYKVNMALSREEGVQNNLNALLRHMFNTITFITDSSATNGYNITNITGATNYRINKTRIHLSKFFAFFTELDIFEVNFIEGIKRLEHTPKVKKIIRTDNDWRKFHKLQ